MRVIITGGCGFLGQMLARNILKKGSLISHSQSGEETEHEVTDIVLADVSSPTEMLFPELNSKIVRVVLGSVSELAFCQSLFSDAGACSVFHLGAVMSGQGEADFDLCLSVNLMGTMNMLASARSCLAPRPRFILVSAGATLGSGAPTDFVSKNDTVGDATRATPHTTYGMTKACSELLLQDFSRKRFVDGRGCRLPTVCQPRKNQRLSTRLTPGAITQSRCIATVSASSCWSRCRSLSELGLQTPPPPPSSPRSFASLSRAKTSSRPSELTWRMRSQATGWRSKL